jgi:hypothetical protein
VGRPAEVATAVPDQAPPLARVAAASAACSVAIGLLERGVSDFAAPLKSYLGDVTLIGSASSFLDTFIADLRIYSPPVRHHPPGFVLGLWILDWLHLRGTGWATAVVIVGGALVAPAVVAIAGRARAWVLVVAVMAPALLWPAPEPAALFVGVTAAAAAVLLRTNNRRGAIAGGVLLGAALMLWYEAVFIAIAPLALLVTRRRFDLLGVAVVTSAAVLLLVGVTGFSWVDGFRARW